MLANGSASRIKMFLLQSDHGIRLTLAIEIGTESEDSHHTLLLINCPVMTCFAVHLRRMMISISMASANKK